jgi:2-polyprenyl-3-methyl-5-hydroxy-6-metoxy-1,4-benzoquinol methylase
MKPEQTAKQYNAIAPWWLDQMRSSAYGLPALERALTFVAGASSRSALDVGCGGEGRFLRRLLELGFACTAMDISSTMLEAVSARHPEVHFALGDICSWKLPRQYDLIIAWDSIFHLPLESHEPVLNKLCAGLHANGVLLFTCGGGDEPGEVRGEMHGKEFEYSTLGVPQVVDVVTRAGCSVVHLDYDQWPENHVSVIARKI